MKQTIADSIPLSPESRNSSRSRRRTAIPNVATFGFWPTGDPPKFRERTGRSFAALDERGVSESPFQRRNLIEVRQPSTAKHASVTASVLISSTEFKNWSSWTVSHGSSCLCRASRSVFTRESTLSCDASAKDCRRASS